MKEITKIKTQKNLKKKQDRIVNTKFFKKVYMLFGKEFSRRAVSSIETLWAEYGLIMDTYKPFYWMLGHEYLTYYSKDGTVLYTFTDKFFEDVLNEK